MLGLELLLELVGDSEYVVLKPKLSSSISRLTGTSTWVIVAAGSKEERRNILGNLGRNSLTILGAGKAAT
jgi:hypothetical protein